MYDSDIIPMEVGEFVSESDVTQLFFSARWPLDGVFVDVVVYFVFCILYSVFVFVLAASLILSLLYPFMIWCEINIIIISGQTEEREIIPMEVWESTRWLSFPSQWDIWPSAKINIHNIRQLAEINNNDNIEDICRWQLLRPLACCCQNYLLLSLNLFNDIFMLFTVQFEIYIYTISILWIWFK